MELLWRDKLRCKSKGNDHIGKTPKLGCKSKGIDSTGKSPKYIKHIIHMYTRSKTQKMKHYIKSLFLYLANDKSQNN